MKKTTKRISLLLSVLLVLCCMLPLAFAEEEQEAPRVLPDGVYTVDFDTDSSMFRANEACSGKGTLTVEGGIQTLHVSLQSRKIVNLFPGTAAEAQESGAVWLEPTEIGRASCRERV